MGKRMCKDPATTGSKVRWRNRMSSARLKEVGWQDVRDQIQQVSETMAGPVTLY